MASISLSTVAIISAVGTAAGAGIAAYSAHEQGVATSNANKQKARVEADNATQQQINMRQKMLTALSTQNAQAGAGGGTASQANTLRQITQGQNDLMVNSSNSSAQVSLLDQAGKNARAAGDLAAVGAIAGGVTKIAGG